MAHGQWLQVRSRARWRALWHRFWSAARRWRRQV